MLKLAIAATVSITFSNFLCNIAEAKIQSHINHATFPAKQASSNNQSQSQSQSNIISKSDLEGIRNAIRDHFGEKNDRVNPTVDRQNRKYKEVSASLTFSNKTDCPFYEVKSFKLLSFRNNNGGIDLSNNIAVLQSEIAITSYTAIRTDDKAEWIFQRNTNSHMGGYKVLKEKITVEKVKGQWRVTSVGSRAPTYK